MRALYARLVLWLIRPAVELHERQRSKGTDSQWTALDRSSPQHELAWPRGDACHAIDPDRGSALHPWQ